MAKKTTRKQLVLQERAEEFNYEERMRGNPMGLRSGGYDMYHQQEEEAERNCLRYALRSGGVLLPATPAWDDTLPSSSRPGQINLR